jgi:hypothetical protein
VQGRDFGKTVEVLDGLDQNDAVVVNPPDSAIDGMPVRIAPPAPQTTQSKGEPGSQQQSSGGSSGGGQSSGGKP